MKKENKTKRLYKKKERKEKKGLYRKAFIFLKKRGIGQQVEC